MTYVDPAGTSSDIERRSLQREALARIDEMMREAIGTPPTELADARKVFDEAFKDELLNSDIDPWFLVRALLGNEYDRARDNLYLKVFNRDFARRTPPNGRPRSGGGRTAPTGAPPFSGQTPSAAPAAGTRARQAGVAAAARRTIVRCGWLDDIRIQGKILRDCTAREVREYREHHSRQGRFLDLLLEQMPSDDAIIGEVWTDAEALNVMRLAGVPNA